MTVNPFIGTSGGIHNLDTTNEPIDFFNLFLPPHLITKIVEETNVSEQKQQEKGSRDKYWKEVTEGDIKKYF